MSDGENDGKSEAIGGPEDLTPNLSEDRPLDSLVPEMRGGTKGGGDRHAGAPSRVGSIHPRVLEVGLEEGPEWTLACWEDTEPVDFGEQFGRLVEATLLKEASRIPEWEAEERRQFVGMRVLTFDSIRKENREILRQLGFEEEPYVADEYQERMNAWRQEATAAGLKAPARPISLWHVPVASFEGERAEALASIESTMLERLEAEVWGQTPGGMSKLLARELDDAMDVEIDLSLEGFASMVEAVMPAETGAIRWIRPVFFQAICDFIGVVLHGKYGLEVQWGMCEPNDQGIVPPPMFRDPAVGRRGSIPVGQELLRWAVLPVEEGRAMPDLGQQLDALAGRIKSKR